MAAFWFTLTEQLVLMTLTVVPQSLAHSERADNAVNVNRNVAYEMTQGSYERLVES